MKRLSLEELKSKKAVVKKLEAIKGGQGAGCHTPTKTSPGGGGTDRDPR